MVVGVHLAHAPRHGAAGGQPAGHVPGQRAGTTGDQNLAGRLPGAARTGPGRPGLIRLRRTAPGGQGRSAQAAGPGAVRADRQLVLFTGAVDTACGTGESATGPFYCPGDERVYIDLGFYRALRERLGAPGDFAQAYVIAHEVGHHVQNIMGTSERVQRAGRGQGAEGDSVRLELQADCYAGVWAFHAAKRRQLLEQGDIEEALTAAAAIGDDTLQRSSTGRVRPETFSHGSSAQRMRWFNRGYEAGDPATCDTFSARSL